MSPRCCCGYRRFCSWPLPRVWSLHASLAFSSAVDSVVSPLLLVVAAAAVSLGFVFDSLLQLFVPLLPFVAAFLLSLVLSCAFSSYFLSSVPQSKSPTSARHSPGAAAFASLRGLSAGRGRSYLDGTDTRAGMKYGTQVPSLAVLPFMGGARMNCGGRE